MVLLVVSVDVMVVDAAIGPVVMSVIIDGVRVTVRVLVAVVLVVVVVIVVDAVVDIVMLEFLVCLVVWLKVGNVGVVSVIAVLLI